MKKKKLILKIVLPIIIIIAIIAIIAIIVMPKSNEKNESDKVAKRILNKFAEALESKDVNEILSCIDYEGVVAWNQGFDSDNFSSSDYKEFIEEYKDVDQKESNKAKETISKYYEDFFDNGDEKYLYSDSGMVKLGKDLYAIAVEFSVGGIGWGGYGKETVIIYKGKIIAPFSMVTN